MGMSSIPASQADTETAAALAALQDADNAIFIAQVDQLVLGARDLGHSQISVNTFGNVNAQTVTSYYVALGYKVSFPDFQHFNGQQPAQLFGDFWVAFWNGTLSSSYGVPVKNPIRLLIGW